MVVKITMCYASTGPITHTIYALLGSFLFSAYIVYDIQLLIARKYLLLPPTTSHFTQLFQLPASATLSKIYDSSGWTCTVLLLSSLTSVMYQSDGATGDAGLSLDDYIWVRLLPPLDVALV